MIIGLAGYARSGKDTVGAILAERGFECVAWADALREMALAMDPIIQGGYRVQLRLSDAVNAIGWDDAKVTYPEVRQFMQRLGTDAGRRTLGEDIWVETLMRRIELNVAQNYVITDCRFPNEAQAVKRTFGLMWRIERPGINPVNAHVSETAIDDWEYDRTIVNNSTLGMLKSKVLKALA